MFIKEIETHLEKIINESNNFDESREMTPEYFSEILNNAIVKILENPNDFLKANFLEEKSSPWLKELYICLNCESDDHKDLITDLFYTTVIILSFTSIIKKEDAKKFFTVSPEIELFRKDSSHRIVQLKNQLADKHPVLSKIINEKFNKLINELESELTMVSAYLSPLNKIEYEGITIPDILFSKTQGRPSDLLIDLILINIHEIAQKINPEQYFSKVIIPTMCFFSEKFPEVLNSNDYNNYDSLRKKINYIIKKHKALEHSQLTGE